MSQNNGDGTYYGLKTQLFDSVIRNDVSLCEIICMKMVGMVSDPGFDCDIVQNDLQFTALETAVACDHWDVAVHLLGLRMSHINTINDVDNYTFALYDRVVEGLTTNKQVSLFTKLIKHFNASSKEVFIPRVCQFSSDGNTMIHRLVYLNSLKEHIEIFNRTHLLLRNKRGQTALHIAAEMKQIESLKLLLALENFNSGPTVTSKSISLIAKCYLTNSEMECTDTGADEIVLEDNSFVNTLDKNKDSSLSICIGNRFLNGVKVLLKHGALVKQDHLRQLVEMSARKSMKDEQINDIVRIYRAITVHMNIVQPKEKLLFKISPDTVGLVGYLNTGMRNLLAEKKPTTGIQQRPALRQQYENVINGDVSIDKYTPLKLACLRGSIDMVREILNTPNVHRFEVNNRVLYDITDLLPSDDDGGRSTSCIQIIANADLPEKKKLQLMQLSPLKEIMDSIQNTSTFREKLKIPETKKKVKKYRDIFGLIVLLCHIVYMSFFSHCNIPTRDWIIYHFRNRSLIMNTIGINDTSTSNNNSDDIYGDQGIVGALWITPPVFVVLIRLAAFLTCRGCFPSKNKLIQLKGKEIVFLKTVNVLWHVTFLVLVAFWYFAYSFFWIFEDIQYQRYLEILSVTLIFGWLVTMAYVRTLFGLHFKNQLHAIFRVMTSVYVSAFAIVYILILVGFGFALHVLNLTALNEVDANRTLADSMYIAFNTVLSIGDGYSNIASQTFADYGGNIDFARVIISFYICLTTIILLNLMIAMMSETYSSIRNNLKQKLEKLDTPIKKYTDSERIIECLKYLSTDTNTNTVSEINSMEVNLFPENLFQSKTVMCDAGSNECYIVYGKEPKEHEYIIISRKLKILPVEQIIPMSV